MEWLEHAHLCRRTYSSRPGRRDAAYRSRSHVALVRTRKEDVIVAARGSQDWDHVWTNVDVRTVPCGAGRSFHRGFWNAAGHLWDEMRDDPFRSERPITFAGHSMGGAIAVALALLAHDARPDHPVRAVTFGAPRYGTGPWTDPFPVENHVLPRDLVTTLPHHLTHFGSVVCIPTETIPSLYQPHGILKYHAIETYVREIRRAR